MKNEVNISVRTLVEYVLKSGSIDSQFRSQKSLAEGTRVHQKIQKMYEDGDQKEVYLCAEIPFEDLTFVIDGRCDGLLVKDGTTTIDEIKSFTQPVDQLEQEGYPVHWAQAQMYAYMYAIDKQLKEIEVQLTYVHKETEEIRRIKKTFTFKDLETIVFNILKNYAPFARLQLEHQANRTASSKELLFPFPKYREGQRKLAGAVYKTIADEKNLFVQAPTGIGKTISTLFPAVKAMGEGQLTKVFYLTAKTITRTTAEEAFDRMRSSGLNLQAVTITAKEKVCFKEESICQKEHCEFADGYYERINRAILDILTYEQAMTREVVETYARKHRVCPFEFSIDLAYAADAVICDYNYVFDPRVSLKRLLEDQKRSTALLVDEAHNLVDRGREMFSASIYKQLFLQLKKEFKGVNKAIYDASSNVNSWFISLKKKSDENEFVLDSLDHYLKELLVQFSEAAEQMLKTGSFPKLLEAYFEAQSFLKIAEFLDDHYVIYAEKTRNDVILKLFCINPSQLLQKMGKGYRSSVFFSATLSPLAYYRDILGGNTDDYQLSVPSPFSKEQTEIYIKPLSTRYRDRERTKNQIVSLIQSVTQNNKGNFLIFFSSYQYLQTIYDEFQKASPEINTLLQTINMTENDREAFLNNFQPNQTKSLVGFAVLGGIFSEGVDLIGERLNGVVIIGVGLPQLCFERNLIKEHFTQNGKNGYDYAYVYPGFNKVLQAGGRLIRSETDQGTIILVDDRFLTTKYQNLLPQEWQDYTVM
ncbi:ATP-dependent DNA helicase [Neobacillus kokaensis]|uniref:ATP-dependent helicase n=1 Tax=Neobacillus kokaensis TaxID=2759023 RepID=A0ABQ3N4N0_9BACI|nr:ATP-dependent DNA helicase [Neobacillus kokaensis]GHH99051.1 ATP-dependent helicase [Neobacillus kokaensis]